MSNKSKQKKEVVILTPLQLELLLVLMSGEAYGLQILDRINGARSKFDMSQLRVGSLYPTLKRLEDAKLIKGEHREEVAGNGTPRRKYYQILAEGKTAISRTKAYQRLLEGETSSEGETLPDLQFVFSSI